MPVGITEYRRVADTPLTFTKGRMKMNISIIEQELRNLESQKQALEALLPFYRNGIIEAKADFFISVKKKKTDNGQSIHSQITDLARKIAKENKDVVLLKQILDSAMTDNLLPGRSRDKVSRRIANTIGLEVQRGNFKKIKAGRYRML